MRFQTRAKPSCTSRRRLPHRFSRRPMTTSARLHGAGCRAPEADMTVSSSLKDDLRAAIRSIPDYPKPGIMFRDITTLLADARAFRRAVDELVQPWAGMKIDKVAGIEARGFILGGAVAHQVSAGFILIRKQE